MTKSAHSDFFGLDLGVGYAPTADHMLAVPNDVFERAEAALQKWAHVNPRPAKSDVATGVFQTSTSTSTPTYGTTPSRTAMAPPTATATAAIEIVPPSLADMHPNPNPSPQSTNTGTVSVAPTAQNPDLAPAPAAPTISTSHAKKRSSPSPSPSPSNSKIQKTFHFVANNDKRTAARIRNTMTSRNLRQSKVSRIAELERELERQRGESELWRVRAVRAGWKDGERLGL